jgi:hypothetical protein
MITVTVTMGSKIESWGNRQPADFEVQNDNQGMAAPARGELQIA